MTASDIRNVSVIGAGLMGHALALEFAIGSGDEGVGAAGVQHVGGVVGPGEEQALKQLPFAQALIGGDGEDRWPEAKSRRR